MSDSAGDPRGRSGTGGGKITTAVWVISLAALAVGFVIVLSIIIQIGPNLHDADFSLTGPSGIKFVFAEHGGPTPPGPASQTTASAPDNHHVRLIFNLRRTEAVDPALYTSSVKFQWIDPDHGGSSDNYLGPDDFHWDWPYHPGGLWLSGAVVPVVRDGHPNLKPHAAQVCLSPPANDPGQALHNIQLTCEENGFCEPPGGAPIRAQRKCVPQVASQTTWWKALLQGDQAMAATLPTVHAAAAGWVTPSVATLAKMNDQTGWAHFRLSTRAFMNSPDRSIEVEISVNGHLVDEDGLTASQRPTRNDPGKPWTYDFALQTLNFEGIDRGCDRVKIALRPRLRPDAANPTLGAIDYSRAGVAQLRYAALRRQPPTEAMLRAGATPLNWRVDFDRPIGAEWRSEMFLGSYAYDPNDPSSLKRASNEVALDKAWLDRMNIPDPQHRNGALFGVIRPPVDPKKPAFGLAVGWLLSENGQLRFTDQPNRLKSIAAWLFQHQRDAVLFQTPADLGTARHLFGGLAPTKQYIYTLRAGTTNPNNVCPQNS